MKKNKCIHILILAIYTFHAVFPLLYSIENAREVTQSKIQPEFVTTDSRSLGGVALRLVSPTHDQNGDDSDFPVLLKKRRTITSSSKDLVEQLALLCSALPPVSLFNEGASILLCVTDDRPICPHGFQLCHSGVSPPSV